jgi:sulfite reductase (NADPH) flavoprotein alpha-component
MLLKELTSLTSPLSEQQLVELRKVAAQLSPQQLAWVSGYLSGISQGGAQLAPVETVQSADKLTILYASQTGNAKGVAAQVKAAADAQGIAAELVSVADYKPKSLKKETHLLIVASTNGEGAPPDDALEFHEFLRSKKAPKLDQLSYSVLALGDSSYEFFCQCGIDFDERLAELGAKRIAPRVDCDLDYDAPAAQWTEQVLKDVESTLASIGAGSVVNLPIEGASSAYNKKNPLTAALSVSQKITGRDSTKDIRHVEIDLSDSGLTYQPGDALGVWFENDAKLVAQLLTRLGLDGEQRVTVDGEALSLTEALTRHYELTQTAPGFVEAWANWSGSKRLAKLLDDKAALREYAATHQVIDVVGEKKALVSADDLLGALRRLTPRLYSIASSQAEVDEEVHLTVGVVSYEKDGETRLGGASGYLAERLEEGAPIRVFVEDNHNFRLPADNNTPVIMVGPGTGIAPFRAFMQQREADGAEGKNWLFFGNPHFTQDFLYQVEWQQYVKSGLLSRIDLAFSRDQAKKIYVQDRLREQAADVYQWLKDGAHLYVCGDANRMAKDVHQALVDIAVEQGGQTSEEAEQWLVELRKNKRYQRDVY